VAGSYPNFAGKHEHEAFFNPSDFVAYLRDLGRLEGYRTPAGIIFCYQPSLLRQVLATEGIERPEARPPYRGMVTLPSTGHQVGILGGFGIGGPAAAGALEDLTALGTRRFISMGTAGSLQRACPVGHTIVCQRAVRDEGVSHHYLPPAMFADASTPLTTEFAAELDRREIRYSLGASWTIDTPYRETVAEARHYQAEGVLCVEMEAAALFAVGAYRGVDVASAFVISDSLADLVWDPQFHSPATATALQDLFDAAVAVLASEGPAPVP
jgi:uridine phosphorylase